MILNGSLSLMDKKTATLSRMYSHIVCFLLGCVSQVGQLVNVDPKAMFLSVLQLVLAPVLVGCTINTLAPGFVSEGLLGYFISPIQ